jgi:hypothetical protein
MHISGKIFVWMTVLLAIAAVVLSAKLLGVRNSWMKQVADLKVINEKNSAEIAAKQLELDQQRSELARTLLGWDRYWTNVAIGLANLEEGIVQADNLGTNQGLGVPAGNELPVVHLFRPASDGGFVYVGPFQAQANENNTAFKATWQPRPGEPQNWTMGNWRVRSLIPASHVDRFVELHGKLTTADELLAQKRHNLEIQTQLIETAQRDLGFRMGELVGTDQNPGNGVLLGEIEQEEQARNLAWATVDSLRRELKTALGNQQALIRKNRDLLGKLPQPARDVVTNIPGN